MPVSLPDIYIHYTDGIVMLQGASQVAIEFLGASYALNNGTTALVAPEGAEGVFVLIDAAGLRTVTF